MKRNNNLSFEQEVNRLSSKNRDIQRYLRVISKKEVRKKVVVNDFCKLKGIKNIDLIVNTLKYFDFNIEIFSEVDVDILQFIIHFTFDFVNNSTTKFKHIIFTSDGYTSKQLRELSKLNDDKKELYKFNSSVNWKEIKFRANAEAMNLKTTAEVFVKVKESILKDYITFIYKDIWFINK